MSEDHAVDVAGTRVVAVEGDLTRQDVDAIVNAANRELQHGGGVAGAISRAGGPTIQQESDAWIEEHGPLEDGEAAVTGAGDLPSNRVVHVAGPVFDDERDDNEDRLRAAVRAALRAARETGSRTVALPAISAGVYGYPPAAATAVIADEVIDVARTGQGLCDEVRLIGLDEETTGLFADGLRAAR